jgi:hypothetical protein
LQSAAAGEIRAPLLAIERRPVWCRVSPIDRIEVNMSEGLQLLLVILVLLLVLDCRAIRPGAERRFREKRHDW